MKWYYSNNGIHTYVRVFINGALAGNLTFRYAEFNRVMETTTGIEFIDDHDNFPAPEAGKTYSLPNTELTEELAEWSKAV